MQIKIIFSKSWRSARCGANLRGPVAVLYCSTFCHGNGSISCQSLKDGNEKLKDRGKEKLEVVIKRARNINYIVKAPVD